MQRRSGTQRASTNISYVSSLIVINQFRILLIQCASCKFLQNRVQCHVILYPRHAELPLGIELFSLDSRSFHNPDFYTHPIYVPIYSYPCLADTFPAPFLDFYLIIYTNSRESFLMAPIHSMFNTLPASSSDFISCSRLAISVVFRSVLYNRF